MDKKYKILVVEDDLFLKKVIGLTLEDEGYQVERAVDGEEAITKLNSSNYDMILLDLMMPKKSGFEVLEELRQKKNEIPILVFSNLSQEKDKKEALSLGAKNYFVKSDISIDEITENVKKYLL